MVTGATIMAINPLRWNRRTQQVARDAALSGALGQGIYRAEFIEAARREWISRPEGLEGPRAEAGPRPVAPRRHTNQHGPRMGPVVVPGGRSTLKLMTARQVGDQLGVSTCTILRWTRAGKLPGFRMPGGALRYRDTDLAAWLVERATL